MSRLGGDWTPALEYDVAGLVRTLLHGTLPGRATVGDVRAALERLR